MYVLKNAFMNIMRAKGRTALIFILVLIVATSACVALSIKTSAESAEEMAYDSMEVSASISIDRTSMMSTGEMDQDSMIEMMELLSEPMSLEELETYATSSTVSDFYYSSSIGLSIPEDDEDLLNYSLDTGNSEMPTEEIQGGEMGQMGGGMEQGMSSLVETSGDFTLTGYSSHSAMTGFVEGSLTILSGAVFDEDDAENSALISEEVSLLNDFAVGDTITLVNPSNSDEEIELTIVGIFTCESSDTYANDIYISMTSLDAIIENSEEVAETYTDDTTGEEVSTAFTLMPSATYVFASPDDYETFQEEVEDLGLDTSMYAVSSTDLDDFEDSMVALENLSSFTMVFFAAILGVGALILIVFNLFTIRERKYEIGVLAAIGMQKPKVALQFMSEVIIVTLTAVIIGTGLGLVVSEPIADVLLEAQIESLEEESSTVSANFGDNFSGQTQGGQMQGQEMAVESAEGMSFLGADATSYIDSLDIIVSPYVLLQLMGLGLLLSILASGVGIISILRFEPLKILSERA